MPKGLVRISCGFGWKTAGGDLVQLHVASNHPGDGDHKTKSFYTFPFGSGAFRRWVNSDAATARGTRYSLSCWICSISPSSLPGRRYSARNTISGHFTG
jgi:hypothetical protein